MRKMLAQDLETRVIPVEFEYLEPKNLPEVLSILNKYGDQAKLLAGGTDLIVGLKKGFTSCKYIVSLKNLTKELSYITSESDKIRIGALTTLREIEDSQLVKDKLQALHEATKDMGSPMIRNIATIGGNICNASPAADGATALLAFDAVLKVVSSTGERLVPIDKFFLGPGKTALKPGEILTEIQVPLPPEGSKSKFLSIKRTGISVSSVCTAVAVKLKASKIDYISISVGAVAPTPVRARKTEQYLKARELSVTALDEAMAILEGEISPITDIRGTAEWRTYASKGLVKKALRIIGGV
jgi:carbon-monoxide dehydrogenase medium subunit